MSTNFLPLGPGVCESDVWTVFTDVAATPPTPPVEDYIILLSRHADEILLDPDTGSILISREGS